VTNPTNHFSCTKLTVHHFYLEPMVGMLSDIFHQKRQSVPLSPLINRFDLHAPEVEKIWSKVIQKTSHFRFQPTFSSLPSLPIVPSAPSAPTDTFLLHQQTTTQPPYEPKSSLVAEQPPRPPSLSPLQLFFFRHQQPIPATIPSIEAYWATGRTSETN